MNNLNQSPCGVRIRFKSNSSKIIFKVHLKRKWGYQKMVNWNSMGFDVYNVVNNEYIHRTVFSPKDGENIFAEIINNPTDGFLCIFLPSYNIINEIYIGIEKNSTIYPVDYDGIKNVPIIFYGNSITQGAAASRSSNTFPNLISKKLDNNILNLSISVCCRGSEAMAHPTIKIVLMTSSNFNNWSPLDSYDEIVKETYENALKNNDNIAIINQKELFEEEEYDFVCIDGCHYTDYGMNKIAEKIITLLNITE